MALTLVVASFAGIAPENAAKAAVSETYSADYKNPVDSGKVTVEYEEGATFFSNSAVSKKQLTLKNVAAASGDDEVCLAIDAYGTAWVIYRNQGLYWYNFEICGKKGVLQKWKGVNDAESIKATRLCFKVMALPQGESMEYSSFVYANYYTSGKDLEDYPLPDWKTLYKVFNGEEYEEPEATPEASTPEATEKAEATQAPTPEPTEVPETQTPATAEPATAEPATAEPATAEPTEAPAAVVEDSGNAIGDASVANGGNGQSAPVTVNGDGNVVNIDQTINIIHNEVIGDGNSVSNENSDTDVTDNTSVIGDGNNTSSKADAELQEVDNTVAGDGNAVVQEPQQVVTETEAETQQSGDNDTAEESTAAGVAVSAPSVPPVVAVTEDTVAAVNPSKEVVKIVEVLASAKPSTVAVAAATPAPTTSVDTSSSKGKCHPRVITSGKRIKLFSKKNKLWGWLTFNKKKGVIRWNGLKKKGVINAGFIKKSWRIGVILKSGKVLSIPYRNGKVKVIGKKAKTFRRTKWGFIKSYVRRNNQKVVGIAGR